MGKRRQSTERVVYELTVQLPPGVSCTRFIAYIQAALRSHHGGLDPKDPIFGAVFGEDQLKIKVKERHVQYPT